MRLLPARHRAGRRPALDLRAWAAHRTRADRAGPTADEPRRSDSRSLGDLLRDLAGGDLDPDPAGAAPRARPRPQDKLHQIIAALVAMLAGALLAFAGLIILLDALVYGLIEAGMERWLAALIVGGVVAVIGSARGCARRQSDLSATRLAPGAQCGQLPQGCRHAEGAGVVSGDATEIGSHRARAGGDARPARRHDRCAAAEAFAWRAGRARQSTYFKEGGGMDLSHAISGAACATTRSRWRLIGLGLGWLAMSGSRRTSRRDGSARPCRMTTASAASSSMAGTAPTGVRSPAG